MNPRTDIGHGVSIELERDDDGRLCFIGYFHYCKDHESYGRLPVQGERAWQLVSEDPLTLSPSVLCLGCKLHGFIREGRWVPA